MDEGADDEPAEPAEEQSIEALRRHVEETYDFDDFTAADMAEMTVEEWSVAFDPDSWITGPDLLDRVEADLRRRVARREVFAVIERVRIEGEPCVIAYTDRSYAVVRGDGSVEGEGTIRPEVEPVVALCSMEDYDVPEGPVDDRLPDPDAVSSGTGEFGNRVIQVIAAILVLAGVSLIGSPLFVSLPAGGTALITTVAGGIFALLGLGIFLLVANARLADRFRAAEYRDRLRAAGVGSAERPEFLPPIDGPPERRS